MTEVKARSPLAGFDEAMTSRTRSRLSALVILVLSTINGLLQAGETTQDATTLPPPNRTGGKPLLQALQDRRTTRDFKPDPLTPQQLSDLLWAAFGINRPENDHRTAPSAKNSQEIDLYLATSTGLFRYDAKPHRLVMVAEEDLRELTGGQEFAKVAALTVIMVADFSRMKDTPEDAARTYAAFDAGCICQNIYLYSASAGLGSVVHDLDRNRLAPRLNLRPEQHIVMAQAVGLPR